MYLVTFHHCIYSKTNTNNKNVGLILAEALFSQRVFNCQEGSYSPDCIICDYAIVIMSMGNAHNIVATLFDRTKQHVNG